MSGHRKEQFLRHRHKQESFETAQLTTLGDFPEPVLGEGTQAQPDTWAGKMKAEIARDKEG